MKKYLLLLFLIGTGLMIFVMAKTGQPLKTADTPKGIIQLELTFGQEHAAKVIAAWTKSDTQPVDIIAAAKENTWWDFIFIFFYVSFLFTAALKIAAQYQEGNFMQRASMFFARLILVEAFLDILENIGMFQMLNGSMSDNTSYFTSYISAIKWASVALVIVFVLIAGVYTLVSKNRQQSY